MYTNKGLVSHAEAALKLNTKYMWGGILRPITENYISQLSKIPGYAAQYPESRKQILRSVIGKNYFGCDCVGLIKSYYWSGKENGGTGSPKYGAAGFPDVNAGAMYAAARVKGKIGTMPEIPGLIVYCKKYPHIGVYIGNGEVIESTLGGNRGDGVVKTKLKDFPWEYWFECPFIEYEKTATAETAKPQEKPVEEASLKVGDRVKVKAGAVAYNGVKLASFVYAQTYDVMEIKGDRVVIGQKRKITAAVRSGDLAKV